jgi:hypothetical protein
MNDLGVIPGLGLSGDDLTRLGRRFKESIATLWDGKLRELYHEQLLFIFTLKTKYSRSAS